MSGNQTLSDVRDALMSEISGLKSRIEEFDDGVPSEVKQELEGRGQQVMELSERLQKLENAPARKTTFDDGTGGVMPIEQRMQKPSEYRGVVDEEIEEIHKLSDAVHMIAHVKGRSDAQFDPRGLKTYKELQHALERKGLTSDGAGTGAEWIPTGFSPDLIRMFEMERMVGGLFTRVPMPTDPFKLPRQTSRSRAYRKGQLASTPSSEPGSADVTLAAETISAYVQASYEMDEDSIVAVVPFIRTDLASALAEGEEDAIINGDTAATHQDSDVTEANDVRTSFDGLRKVAVAGAKQDLAGAPTATTLRQLRAATGKYGVNPRRMAWIVSPVGLMHMLSISETMTVDKYGPLATLVTGELGRFDGIPISPSGFVREDLNVTGVEDGVTSDNTIVALVRTDAYMIGVRREAMLETDRNIVSGANDIVASMREDFQSRFPTTDPTVAIGYNVPNTL